MLDFLGGINPLNILNEFTHILQEGEKAFADLTKGDFQGAIADFEALAKDGSKVAAEVGATGL
jgi:hypothetical protein